MKILLSIIFLFALGTAQANEMLTELGLAWGQTQKTLSAKGYQLTNCLTKKSVTSCDVTHHIEGPALDAMYILFFDKYDGLQKFQMPVSYLEDDATGTKGIDLYHKLKANLTKRYDEPKSYEYAGQKLYTGQDEFYQCLQYDGCGAWVSFWNTSDGDFVYINLVGVDKGAGYLILFYESKRWQELVEAMK